VQAAIPRREKCCRLAWQEEELGSARAGASPPDSQLCLVTLSQSSFLRSLSFLSNHDEVTIVLQIQPVYFLLHHAGDMSTYPNSILQYRSFLPLVHYRARHFLPYFLSELVEEDDAREFELSTLVGCAAMSCEAGPGNFRCTTTSSWSIGTSHRFVGTRQATRSSRDPKTAGESLSRF
jgi:hypothetical protein